MFKFIKPARKPQAFKPGDEWRPERSVGNPAKPGSPKETLDFSPGSFICDFLRLWKKPFNLIRGKKKDNVTSYLGGV